MESSAPVNPTLARQLYATMKTAEALDDRLRRGFSRGEMSGVIWPSRGQEAISAGLGAALRRDDRLITTYRGLHDLVGKGVPLIEILGEVLGHSLGASRGKAGTMHITAPEHGVMLSTGIVGAGVPVAVGLALAARQEGSDRVVAVCFGDGATNTGSFHEGMNLAAVWQLPVIFVCQNNLYAEHTPIEQTMHIKEVKDRALAYDMPGIRVDGNDPEAVYEVVQTAAERGRKAGGPTLLECVTFRFKGHSFGDTQNYMPKEVLAAAEANDPIPRYRQKLLDRGDASEQELAAIDEDAVVAVETALKAVLESPEPAASEIDTDLYVDMGGVPA